MPSVQRQDTSNTTALITVTVTKAELQPKINAELKRVRNKAAIKGFRQGHAPADLIKRLHGTAIVSEVLGEMLHTDLYDFLRDSKLDVLGQPIPSENQQRYSFRIDSLEDEYAVEYEVGFVPPFDLKGLSKDNTYERLTVADLDDLARQDLDYSRRRMGVRSNPEDNIRDNDIVKIAVRELDGDQPKADGWETTVSLLPETLQDENLKQEILTKKKGDTLRFNMRALQLDKSEATYRKHVLNMPSESDMEVGDWFEGPIEEVNRLEPAEMNEEFFQSHFGDGVSTEAEALEQVKAGIVSYYAVRANALLMRRFQERLLEQNPLDLPDAFLKRWLAFSNESLQPEQIEREYGAFAANLRWSLLRDRIKEMFGIEVMEADLRAHYADKIRNYFQAELPDNVIESTINRFLENKEDVEDTARQLESDKIFEAIVGQITVQERAIPSEEFHKIMDEVVRKSEQEQAADATLRETIEE